jgi:hypothetical protein
MSLRAGSIQNPAEEDQACWNAAASYRLFPQEGREAHMQRRRVKHTTSLADRVASRIAEIKAKAAALPEGSRERERLMRRAWLADPLAEQATSQPSEGPSPSQ